MKKILPALALFLSACSQQKPSDSVMLLFAESEGGSEPFQTRFVVTPEFIRIDDGEGANDFILFNRREQTVYSVYTEEHRIMLVKNKPYETKPPFELKHEVKMHGEMKDAPKIDDKVPQHVELITNGDSCYHVVAVEGLFPQVVEALREFHNVLANDSKSTFNTIPADLHDACDMSMTTFASTRYLDYGFPVQEWGKKVNYHRALVDYKRDYAAKPGIFQLPKDFKRYTAQAMREGKVRFGN